MEIRVENTITVDTIARLKAAFDDFFSTDFSVTIDGDYVYFRDR